MPWSRCKLRPGLHRICCHQSIDNEDSFTLFQLLVANTVQFSLDLFLTPQDPSGHNYFFCNYCSSLQPAIIEHYFSRVGQFLIIQLKRFVNFQGTVTKDINIVKSFANIPIPVIFDNDIVEQRRFTLISTGNYPGNLYNGHYTAHVKNNFSHAWYYCNDAVLTSCSKEVLENNPYLFFRIFLLVLIKFLFLLEDWALGA